jgi:hypothetical protein
MAMLRREREDLERLSRDRERLAKAAADQRAAELRADFQRQLAATYSFDQDSVWKEAMRVADEAVSHAQRVIADRCEELGIPASFAPGLNLYWHGRGENAIKDRRAELTKVAYTRIEALAKDAKLKIGLAASEIRVQLLSGSLETDEAKLFLRAMPTPEEMMPKIELRELEDAAAAAAKRREQWLLQ